MRSVVLPGAPNKSDWWTKPIVVLPVAAVMVVLIALLTPQVQQGRNGDQRLTTHRYGTMAARLLYELAARTGWTVQQRDNEASPVAKGGRAVHAVLAPVVPISPSEAHAVMQAVRSGDGLLYVMQGAGPLADSLHVSPLMRDGMLPQRPNARTECGGGISIPPALWGDARVHLFALRWRPTPPRDVTTFAELEGADESKKSPGAAAAGFPLGAGRVVVVSDPDLLRTDVLRYCRWGADVVAMELLEYLRAGGTQPRTVLEFDEFHQGFGGQVGMWTVIGGFLVGHPVGRMLLLCVFASLVLLAAIAPRPIPPVEVERIERRDPMEQVDALAHAYERVRATRTLAARLLRGVRWRVERGGAMRARDDEQFLGATRARHPALGTDVELVERALREPLAPRELPDLAAALRRIELTLSKT